MATITQIDGVGAFDHCRRAPMLRGIRGTPTAHRLLPSILMSYGSPSTYEWQEDTGEVHEITQGEGVEQGDRLMPALFSLGMAEALRDAQALLH